MNNKLEIIYLDNNDLTISFPAELRNKTWSQNALLIQTILNSKTHNDKSIRNIEFNLSNVEWSDPMPMLALLVNLYQSIKFTKDEIIFILPKLEEISLFLESRFLKFLYDEGFYSSIKKVGIIKNEIEDENYEEKLKHNNASLIYSDCSLLKSTLIDLNTLSKTNEFDTLIIALIKEIETNLTTKGINAFYLNNLLYKTTTFLTETIDNVRLHAYEPNQKKTVGCYIRYRNGLANKSLDYDTLKLLDIVLSDEEKTCPKLHREYLDTKEGCIEIFIIDAGKGISETFGNRIKDEKWPLRKTTKDIFTLGKRGKNKPTKGKSDKGGLFLIGKIFELDNDYLNLFECNEYVGGFLPFKHLNNEYLDGQTGGFIHGTHWIGRVSWKTKQEDELENWFFIQNNEKHSGHSDLEIFSATEYNDKLSDILEESFSYDANYKDRLYFFDNREFRDRIRIYDFKAVQNLDKDILLMPGANVTKNELIDLVTFRIVNDQTECIKHRNLLIADVPDDERVLYFETFNNLKLDKRFFFDKIIILTKRLRICVFELKNKTYLNCNRNSIKNFFNLGSTVNIFNVHSILRTHDSDLLWNQIIEMKKTNDELFIEEDVKWNNEVESISGYLNFAEVLTYRLAENLLLNSLERIIGLLPSKECSFSNMDILTKQITNHANAIFFPYRKGETDFQINVGSIFVTGQNEKNALWGFENNSHSFNIHFFVHFQSSSQPISLYNWNIKETYGKTTPQYERIGRSHVISRGGYKAVRIPRYDKNGISVYYRNPVETYQDWQNTRLSYLKIGNFEYENNFDLFKIDIFTALKHSFHYSNELAEFLVTHFFIALGGVRKEQLKKAEYWQKIETVLSDSSGKKDIQNYRTSDFCKNTCLVIYPYHPNTAYAIKKIKECLSEQFHKKIIQLTPIKSNHNGSSFLFSPDAFKKIRRIIQESPAAEREVILFDDSIVSGRTRKEIKHILLNLSASKVKTLGIVDRFRLPYIHQSLDRNRFYWRFDVPRLGVKNTNPLTRALTYIQSFSNNLNSVSQRRIVQWNKAWGTTSVYLDSPKCGINPSKIELNDPLKSFSLKWSQEESDYVQICENGKNGDENKIRLTNSFGLTLNTTEVHTLTGQDNRAYVYARGDKGYLSNGAKIELLCTQLLLFPKEFPKENHFNMLKMVYDTLEDYRISNNHTVLASLTLIIQDKVYISKLINYIEEKHRASSYIDCKNIDLRILLSYLTYAYQIKNPIFNFVSNCIISNTTLINTYKRIHIELFQEREIHYSPIIALYKKREKPLFNRLDNSLHSLLNIKECIANLHEGNCKSIQVSNNPVSLIIEDYINKIDDILLKYERSIDADKNIEKHDNEVIQHIIGNIKNDIVNPLINIHDSIYFKITTSAEEKPNIIRELNKIKASISEDDWLNDAKQKGNKVIPLFLENIPSIIFSDKSYEVVKTLSYRNSNSWITFDFNIKRYIRDLIANAIYASEIMEEYGAYYIIDIVLVDNDYLRISFSNKTSIPNADKEANEMNLLRENFENLGGKYSNSLLNNTLIVNIDIPIN